MLGILALAAGLLASYLFVCVLFHRITLEKFIAYLSTNFFLLTILLGYVYKLFQFSLSSLTFLTGYSIFAAVFWIIKRHLCYLEFSKYDFLTIGVLIGAVTFYLYPSLPYLSPACYVGDCSTHMQLMAYIYDKQSFMYDIDYGFVPFRIYPFGIHIVVGMVSVFLNIHPIITVSIIISFVSALSMLVVYGVSRELSANKWMPILAVTFVSLSIYPISAISELGFYGQILGNLFLLVFLWATKDYINENSAQFLMLLGALFFATVFTFTPYLSIVLGATILIFFIERPSGSINYRHLLVFLGVAAGLLWKYFLVDIPAVSSRTSAVTGLANIHSFLETSGNFLKQDGLVTYRDTRLMYLTLPILTILSVLTVIWAKQYRFILFFLGAIIFQISVGYLLYLYLGIAAYWYLKIYYLLVYPMAIASAIFVDAILYRMSWKKYHAVPVLLLCAVMIGTAILFPSLLNTKTSHLASDTIRDTSWAWVAKYNRNGNVPELILISDWIKANLPEHSRVYYAGPYHCLWLYALTRHKILQDGARVQVEAIPANDTLFRTENVVIYKTSILKDKEVSKCYSYSLDYHFPDA